VIPLGIYVRISDDDRDEDGNLTREGVKRQEADCRKLADELSARLGVQIITARVYDDNNITAADERIRRPDFEQLLKDLESGVIRGLLFYHADRVCRLELDAARLTRLFRLNPKLIGLSVTGGTDLSTDEGRAMFVVQAVMGGMEVAATRRRVTRRNKDAAAAGKIHGGKRPFGWEEDRKTLRQPEADLLGKAIRDIPKGKTIGMIRKEWIAAGVTATSDGKGALRDQTVLVKVINPRVCGYRVYRSADDRRDIKTLWVPDTLLLVDGEPVIGDWTPIVTPEDWKACVATLEARRTPRPTSTPGSMPNICCLESPVVGSAEPACMVGSIQMVSTTVVWLAKAAVETFDATGQRSKSTWRICSLRQCAGHSAKSNTRTSMTPSMTTASRLCARKSKK
jgi:DNA invertase Pin-like site-specific DNA recombinase